MTCVAFFLKKDNMTNKKIKQDSSKNKQKKTSKIETVPQQKKQAKEQFPVTAENGYQRVHADAIERLLNAENAPEVPDEEIEKYISKKKHKIPSWFKVLFIKFWFAGAVCYFVMWGLGTVISGLDLMAVLAIMLGMVTDLMVNHALRHFEPFSGAWNKWIMFPQKKFWTFFLNILYASFLLCFIIMTYNGVNTLIVGSADTAESVPIGVEPILFGLLFLGFDMLFLNIRNGLKKVFSEAGKKA